MQSQAKTAARNFVKTSAFFRPLFLDAAAKSEATVRKEVNAEGNKANEAKVADAVADAVRGVYRELVEPASKPPFIFAETTEVCCSFWIL